MAKQEKIINLKISYSITDEYGQVVLRNNSQPLNIGIGKIQGIMNTKIIGQSRKRRK